jgi:hypothetical protein
MQKVIVYNKLKLISLVLATVLLSDFIFRISGRDGYVFTDSSTVINIEIATIIFIIILICVEICKIIYNKNYKLLLCIISITLSSILISKYFIHLLTNQSISEATNIVFSYVSGGDLKNLSVNIDGDVKEAYSAYAKKVKKIDDLTLTTCAPHLRVYEFKVCPSGSQCFNIRLMIRQSKTYNMWIHGVLR